MELIITNIKGEKVIEDKLFTNLEINQHKHELMVRNIGFIPTKYELEKGDTITIKINN